MDIFRIVFVSVHEIIQLTHYIAIDYITSYNRYISAAVQAEQKRATEIKPTTIAQPKAVVVTPTVNNFIMYSLTNIQHKQNPTFSNFAQNLNKHSELKHKHYPPFF